MKTKTRHAELSGSIAHRWIPCPGSIKRTRGVEQKRSLAARLGTSAHALGEQVLAYWKKTGEGIKGLRERFKPDMTFRYDDHEEKNLEGCATDDMIDAVFQRVEFVLENGDRKNTHTEMHVSLENLVRDNMYGTADDVIDRQKSKTLLVNEYKHGFIPVHVGTEGDPNVQLMYYAAGALDHFGWRHEDVELSIIQPRSMEVEPIQQVHVKAKHVREWATETLYAAAHATDDPAAPLVAGEWCRFCPALDECPAAQAQVSEAAGEDFAELARRTIDDLPPVPRDPRDIVRILRAIPIIDAWIKAVEEKALEIETAKPGTLEPDFKLVAKRSNRRWPEGIGSVDLYRKLQKSGLVVPGGAHKLLTEPKVISPAQLEAVVGKRKDVVAAINAVAERPDAGYTLAKGTDKRAAVGPGKDFEELW